MNQSASTIKEDLKRIGQEINKEKREKAMAIRNSKTELKRELMSAKSCLKTEFRNRFTKNTFDFEKARLVSDDGELALQWRLRTYPNRPESYENQQTNRGTVVVIGKQKNGTWA